MFDPTCFDFSYKLSKYDCFRKLTGKCSLKLTDKEFEYYASNEERIDDESEYYNSRENSVHYCRLLLQSFKTNGMLRSIEINPHSCGHYSFTDGQHRVCVAKTTGMMKIPAKIHNAWNCECRVCYFKETNPLFRIKHWLGKTDEFIR